MVKACLMYVAYLSIYVCVALQPVADGELIPIGAKTDRAPAVGAACIRRAKAEWSTGSWMWC